MLRQYVDHWLKKLTPKQRFPSKNKHHRANHYVYGIVFAEKFSSKRGKRSLEPNWSSRKIMQVLECYHSYLFWGKTTVVFCQFEGQIFGLLGRPRSQSEYRERLGLNAWLPRQHVLGSLGCDRHCYQNKVCRDFRICSFKFLSSLEILIF